MTSTTSTRGRKPSDHQAKAGTAADEREARAANDAVLADMPELVAPTALRMRDRAKIRAVMLHVSTSGVFSDDGEEIELDPTNASQADLEKIRAMDDLAVEIDEWAESIAIDKTAYAKWAGGKGYDEFFAILNRYNEAVGESNGS